MRRDRIGKDLIKRENGRDVHDATEDPGVFNPLAANEDTTTSPKNPSVGFIPPKPETMR
jgi:hypothetical protein